MMHETTPTTAASTPPQAPQATSQPLGFGRVFSDTMVLGRYTEGRGWHDFECQPRRALSR
mgnify:CR=1 FL=1